MEEAYRRMNAAEAVSAALAAGIHLAVEGDQLVLEAAAPPPRALVDLVAQHRSGIATLLRAPDGWAADDWQIFFEERAAIAEFDGGFDRAEAERRAGELCLTRWQQTHPPAPSPPLTCAHCGGAVPRHHGRVAYVAARRAVQVHPNCITPWQTARRMAAIVAMRAMGLRFALHSSADDIGSLWHPAPHDIHDLPHPAPCP